MMEKQNKTLQKLIIKKKQTVADFFESRGLNPQQYALINDETSSRMLLDETLEENARVTIIPMVKGG